MPQHSVKLMLKLVSLAVLVAVVLPSAASAQATRTWVSGVGDDANPCSRTAPCKTFAGAISKTAAGGIIMPMDDGGFGTVTITKPITIDGGHHSAGVLSSGGINGINVNINPATQPANFVNNGRVVLKNLKMEGNTSIPSSGGFTPGLNGVRITNARNVKIVNSDIGFYSRSGVSVEPDASQTTKVQIIGSYIHDNGGAGIGSAPKNGAITKVTARNNDISDNACGIAAASFGFDAAFNFGNSCALAASTSGIVGTSSVFASNNSITDGSNAGVMARGGSAAVRMTGNDVTRNDGVGIRGFEGAAVLSFGNNAVADNGAPTLNDGNFTGPVIPLQKSAKKH